MIGNSHQLMLKACENTCRCIKNALYTHRNKQRCISSIYASINRSLSPQFSLSFFFSVFSFVFFHLPNFSLSVSAACVHTHTHTYKHKHYSSLSVVVLSHDSLSLGDHAVLFFLPSSLPLAGESEREEKREEEEERAG